MNINNPAESISAAQQQSVEQALAYSRAAAQSFERLTRQHYAMVGDLVDYTLAQLHLPSNAKDPRAVLEAQAENARELAEKTRSRMEEYAEIANDMRSLAGSSVSAVAASATPTVAGGTPAAPSKSRASAPAEKAPAAKKPATRTAAKASAKPATRTAAKPAAKSRAKKKSASRKS